MDRPENHVILSPAVAEIVQQAIETGEYASQDEIISEALVEWRLRRELNPSERDGLCRLWDNGIASGAGQFTSMDEIRQEARRRWAEEQGRRKHDG